MTRPSAADAAESDPGASETIGDDTPLSQLTTMRVGGPAERILVARSGDELVRCATELWHGDEPWLLLGGGSNTVMNDEGFPGAVLLVRSTGMEVVDDPEQPEGRVRLRVQAGHDWDALVAACVERGWSGVEALSGIPGLAGAAPVQNIGAYGQELSDVLHSIEFLDRESGEVQRLAAEQLQLGYRDSAIKRGLEGVVLSIDLLLSAGAAVEPFRNPFCLASRRATKCIRKALRARALRPARRGPRRRDGRPRAGAAAQGRGAAAAGLEGYGARS
ncbi:FAD-binding protein [Leucobacter sp. UCD-THU]|uniref:FAD-binding protein n=1 Tax=Leucobacter sp. UCD-THU TaxID=1292023 RepID=UPI0026A91FA3|nr:FAD-binding protein [Leucobacter sp. UCD-THU]